MNCTYETLRLYLLSKLFYAFHVKINIFNEPVIVIQTEINVLLAEEINMFNLYVTDIQTEEINVFK